MRGSTCSFVTSIWGVLLAAGVHAQEAPRLRGRVLDADGRPVASATVSAVRTPAGWEPSAVPGSSLPDDVLAKATTGSDGAYAIDAAKIPRGPFPLRVDAPGRAPLLFTDERIAFGAPALPQAHDVTLPGAVTVEGLLLDPRGAPAPKVRVTVRVTGEAACVTTTRSTGDGRVRVEGLPGSGHALFVADSGDGALARLSVILPRAGSLRVALHLEAPHVVTGTIVSDDAEPKPVAGARIVLLANERAAGALSWWSGGASSGIVVGEAASSADGTFAAIVPSAGDAFLAQPGFSVMPLRPGRNVARRRAPTAGTVVDETGAPVRGARVKLHEYPITTFTDEHGAFTLPDGGVSVASPTDARAKSTVRDAPARVVLPRPRALAGIVVAPASDGGEPRPVARAVVRTGGVETWDAITATDAAGRFEMTLPARGTRLIAASGALTTVTDLAPDAAMPLRIVLAPASSLKVAVTRDGKPAPGASVVATSATRPFVRFTSATDAKGVAPFTLPATSFVLRARTDEARADDAERVAGSGATGDPLKLLPIGRVKARCVDAKGPIEGVLVTAPGRSMARRMGAGTMTFWNAPEPAAGTGPDGIAILDDLVVGECTALTLRRPGLAPKEVDCARAAAMPGGATLDVVMERGASVRGVVRDPAGNPVPGAMVTARPDATTSAAAGDPRRRWLRGANGVAQAFATAAGAYRIDDIPAGRVELVASADHFLASEPLPADLASGAEAETDIVLRAGASIRGVVLTGKGQPAAGAHVHARPADWSRAQGPRGTGTVATAVAESDGSFEIDGLDPALARVVVASLDGNESEPMVVTPGGDDVSITLRNGGVIEGRLLGGDDLGEPARVSCTGAPEGGADAMAESAGAFVVRGLKAGTWSCTATAGDVAEGTTEGIVVKEGETTSATIRMGPRTLQDVLVRDAVTGEPIAGARVTGGSAQVTTDAQGHARLAVTSWGGTPTVYASATGYRQSQARVPSPKAAVLELRLSKAAAIRGIVTDAQDQPVAGITVGSAVAGSATTDTQGAFELTPSWRVVTRTTLLAERTRDGVLERGRLDVEVPPEGLSGIVLRLESQALGSAMVIVTDEAGPVVGATVMLAHESSEGRLDVRSVRQTQERGEGRAATGVTDEEGSFLGESLRPGTFTILAGRPDETTLRASGTVEVAPGARATAAVRIAGGSMVTGTVVRNGRPQPGAMVSVSGMNGAGRPEGQLAGGVSGPDGGFSLGPVAKTVTDVIISAELTGNAWDTKSEVRAVAGGPPVTIDLSDAGFTGTVVSGGLPVSAANVKADRRGAPGNASARTRPDGTFELKSLTPGGIYDVSAALEGKAPVSVVATAPASGTIALGVLELRDDAIAGTARAADGRALTSFLLFLVRPDGSRLPRATVDVAPDGSWSAGAPASERLAYRASADGLASVLGTIEPGATPAIVFPVGATLAVSVDDGDPVPGAGVRVVSWNGIPADDHLVARVPPSPLGWQARTDETGTIALQPMPAGAWVIAAHRDGREGQASVTLADGDRQGMTIRLPER